MKIVFIILSFVIWTSTVYGASLTSIQVDSIDSKPTSLKDYKGKAIMVVNIATKCGYTPQLAGLEKLYKKYSSKGLVVLGVPSNDFGEQTPENHDGIKKFCKLNYDVSFPLTAKLVVKGKGKHPLYAGLISLSSEKKEVRWNFEKFLVGSDGALIQRFESKDKPMDSKVVGAVEKALKI